ncbi:hypothetical protein GF406_07050 [candidate division KSB1 bacterium]|nr:hypothetical protein [candidate division KSB1 bacterium]
MRYVVDTCIFNKLLEGVLDLADLPSNGEYCATHIQKDELNQTKDKIKRERLSSVFEKVTQIHLLTETTAIGISKIGNCRLGDGVSYIDIRARLDKRNKGKHNNIQDAMIAEVAFKNNYTLLTTDKDLAHVMIDIGGRVTYWPSQ